MIVTPNQLRIKVTYLYPSTGVSAGYTFDTHGFGLRTRTIRVKRKKEAGVSNLLGMYRITGMHLLHSSNPVHSEGLQIFVYRKVCC